MQPYRHKNSSYLWFTQTIDFTLITINSNQMKRFLQISALALVIMLGGSWRNNAAAQVDMDISYQTFYDELSPYGEWVDYPEYGYVWVPGESDGFRPYETNGHWVWSDEYEWMWVSDYEWGWAPFHYGRWFNDPYYGWMWMPGYEWSPAWVAWRDGGDYYGWAPLRPGINISLGFSIGSYNPPVDYWCFAPRRYISSPRIYDYCLDRSRNVTIINNTTIINNYNRRNNAFVTGPRRMDAERYAGRINPVRFREASGPGRAQFRNNEVSVYRPRVERNNNRQFTPRNFERYDRNRGQNNGFVRDRGNNNGNNLPDRRNDNRFDRRNDNSQPGNGNNDNNRFGRRNDQQRNNGNENRNNERQGNIFDRNNNNNNDRPANNQREMRRPFERQSQPQPDNRNEQRPNVFDRRNNDQPVQNRRDMRNDNRFERQPQVERQPEQNQQRQFERRQPQVERQPQQNQPRQFENRGNGGNDQQRGGGNDNSGRGRGRRF